MKDTKLTVVALGALSLALAGCNSGGGKGSAYKPKTAEKVAPAAVAAGQEADLFPMKTGNTWVYEVNASTNGPSGNRNSSGEITFRITDVKETPDGKEAKVDVSTDGKPTDKLVWRLDKSGLYQVSASVRDPKNGAIREVAYEPPLRILKFPLKEGSVEEQDVTGVRAGAQPGPDHKTVSYLGAQETDTLMGRMSAIVAEETGDFKDKDIQFKSVSTTYWAPKIGLVRYIQEASAVNKDGRQIVSSTTLKLKSHQP